MNMIKIKCKGEFCVKSFLVDKYVYKNSNKKYCSKCSENVLNDALHRLEMKMDLFLTETKKEEYKQNFVKCVKGYHLINSSPINETVWEDINSVLFSSSNIDIYSKSNGSHLSGMDIHCSLGKISNKSAKYSKNRKGFDISSYRLTTICSENRCGNPADIIREINNRKNFNYYSFIVREETHDNFIHYDWLFIPSDYSIFDPLSYTWEPTIGKKGNNKGIQVGWNTNTVNGCKMSITFSMSSQLWIQIEMNEELKSFIIASTTINKKQKYNYIDICNMLG